MKSKNKKETPKREESTLTDWADVIHQMGERHRVEQAQLRKDRAAFLRTYFDEDASRISDLGVDTLLRWMDNGPVLNSKFSALLLNDERALNVLWDEIAHRTSFEEHLRSFLKLETPE